MPTTHTPDVWQDRVPDMEVLEQANTCSLNALLAERRFRWLGQVRRMACGRIPKDLLYGKLVEGRRKAGRPKLRLKDACKRDMIKCSINPDTWERQAEDRSAWRAAVRQGTVRAEAELIETATQKRARRKQRTQQASVHKCPNCGRDCHSQIGLHNHSRWCSQPIL